MEPLVRIGLDHAEELPVHVLGQVLFDMDEDKEEFVLAGGQRRIRIWDVAAIEARKAVNGVGAHPLEKGRLKRWQQARKLIRQQGRERPQACRVMGDIVIAKDRCFLSLRSFYHATINHDTVYYLLPKQL